jgi:Asp-tRNA(Asn)/Glu-tRNA(Gln) amidotransferase A subunit family amidase
MRTGVVHHNELGKLDQIDNTFLKQFSGRAQSLGALEVADAEWRRSQVWERVQAFMSRYDVLLLPATQTAAFPKEIDRLTEIVGQKLDEPLQSSLSTYAISITGLPALSVPCGFTESSLPVGLQIVGRWRRDADVLRAAAAFEDANPYHRRRPPLVDAAKR